jgi:NADH:ubiquinone oxidoreductase subunit K
MNNEILYPIIFFLCFLIFTIGLVTIFIRRHAFWVLVGSLLVIKSVGAMALFLSKHEGPAKDDFGILALLAIGLVPAAGFLGVLVLHRSSRFGGTLDLEREDQLRE